MIPEQKHSNSKFKLNKIFYGWLIVATMVAVTFAQTALYNPALSVFLKPITEEFGWTRSVFAGAITTGTILGGILALVIGPILDKKGAKAVLFFGFLFFGIAVGSMFFVNHLWQFYMSVVTGRFIIAGLLQVAPGVVVSKWFIRRRGRAMAFAVVGTRFGQMAMPLLAQISLSIVGWRSASVVLAVLVWTVTLIPILMFLKRQPEDMGLLPDGMVSNESGKDQFSETTYSLKEAIRTPAFYFILIATSGLMFNIGGINFNLFPYLTDKGISEDSAISILTFWAGVSALGALGIGFVVEKFHIRIVMAVGFLVVTLGVFILMLTTNLYYAYSFALVHGLAFGALPMLIQLVWAEYFGRAHQGAIRGFVTPIQLVIQAGGPLAGTFMYDIMGDYFYALILFALIYLISAISILMAKPLLKPSM